MDQNNRPFFLLLFTSTLLFFLLTLLLACSPTEKKQTNENLLFENKNREYYQLSNGLTVVLIHSEQVGMVSEYFCVNIGSADEVPGKTGIAHFLEHLMFKGTPRYPKGEYEKLISSYGGELNAFTYFDLTCYHALIPPEILETVLEMEADRFQNLHLVDEEVNAERDTVLSELEERSKDPISFVRDKIFSRLFGPNSAYGRPVIGYKSDIEKLSTEDVIEFYRSSYKTDRSILIINGAFDKIKLPKAIERYFGVIPSPPKTNRNPRINNKAPLPGLVTHANTDNSNNQTVSITRSYRVSNYINEGERNLNIEILNIVENHFCNKGSSSFYNELMTIPFIVSAYCNASVLKEHSIVSFSTTVSDTRYIADAQKLIDEFIKNKILNWDLTQEDLEELKEKILVSEALSNDDLRNESQSIAFMLMYGYQWSDLLDSPQNKVTLEIIKDELPSIFNPEMSATGLLWPIEGDN